ncbi:cysteine synthase [Clostridia bacterium]|nr:cysteine synthase [Clostridia bacterium]
MYYKSIQELIGNTPIVQLSRVLSRMSKPVNPGVNLFAKLELYNPSGSVKDRIGQSMLLDAEQSGALVAGGTIIEATAGNTGLGIAFAALGRGYRVIFVVPEKFSQEKQTLMRALGAEVINTPKEGGMQGASKKAEELRDEIPNAVAFRQFKNPVNPETHYKTTGAEIYAAMEGKIDYIVCGAGSGGTFSGIMKYMKERDPNIKGILADPLGSVIGGGEHGEYDIEGIGNDFIAETMDTSLVDSVIKITDREAFEHTRLLAREEGIIAGSSSGAALAASLRFAATIEKGNIVTVFPDRGDRYFSKNLLG